jgi:hypothetical protein
MARKNQIWKIESFQGGLNTLASSNDLDANFAIDNQNTSIQVQGKVTPLGKFVPLDVIGEE